MRSLTERLDAHWSKFITQKWQNALATACQTSGMDIDSEVALRKRLDREYYSAYRQHYIERASRCEPRTVANDLHYVCPVIAEVIIAGVALADFRAEHMQTRQARRKQDEKKNNNTLRKEIQMAKPFLQGCVRRKLIKCNPLADYPLPPKQKALSTWTTHDGVHKLLKAIRDIRRPSINPGSRCVPRHKNNDLVTRDQAMVIMEYRLALRPCELVGLTLSDYRPTEHAVLVRNTKTKFDRLLPTYEDVEDMIDKWLRERPRDASCDRLFVSDRGTPITTWWWAQQFRRYADFAGMPDLTPMSLRHTGITAAATAAGVLAASRLAGHTNSQTTKHYLHDLFADTRAALEKTPRVNLDALKTGRSGKRIM